MDGRSHHLQQEGICTRHTQLGAPRSEARALPLIEQNRFTRTHYSTFIRRECLNYTP